LILLLAMQWSGGWGTGLGDHRLDTPMCQLSYSAPLAEKRSYSLSVCCISLSTHCLQRALAAPLTEPQTGNSFYYRSHPVLWTPYWSRMLQGFCCLDMGHLCCQVWLLRLPDSSNPSASDSWVVWTMVHVHHTAGLGLAVLRLYHQNHLEGLLNHEWLALRICISGRFPSEAVSWPGDHTLRTTEIG
jgi:hypothetical protein